MTGKSISAIFPTGQQQMRVAISALLSRPKMLPLDEPSMNPAPLMVRE